MIYALSRHAVSRRVKNQRFLIDILSADAAMTFFLSEIFGRHQILRINFLDFSISFKTYVSSIPEGIRSRIFFLRLICIYTISINVKVVSLVKKYIKFVEIKEF